VVLGVVLAMIFLLCRAIFALANNSERFRILLVMVQTISVRVRYINISFRMGGRGEGGAINSWRMQYAPTVVLYVYVL
jgi:hypothetical protein